MLSIGSVHAAKRPLSIVLAKATTSTQSDRRPLAAVGRNEHGPHKRYLTERVEWLTRLRWIAGSGVLIVAGVTAVLGIVESPAVLVAMALLMMACNGLFWLWSRQRADHPVSVLQRAIALQIFFDLTVLTILLHWSGGIENPFAAFFVFHMAIGAMLLPLPMAMVLGVAASLLHGGTVLAELAGVLAHHPLSFAGRTTSVAAGFWHTPEFVFGYTVAFVLTLFGVIYFVQSVASRQRRAEAISFQRERVALSRERLARVGEIAAGVAHTIRNPLHGVMNCVEILRSSGELDSSFDETLALMSEGLGRIESVTQRLLVLTRDAPLDRHPQDLSTVVRDTLEFFSVRATRKRVRVVSELSPEVHAAVDANRVSEALLNVLDNAVDACSEGDQVTVSTSQDPGEQGLVRIEVSDTGAGIDPRELPKIFDPFYTTKAVGEGSGLGLAIARRVIEQHGGSVRVESEPGAGTRVILELPTDVSVEEQEDES
ncbi:MAG: GHKL domain-containing protein [Candidatus Dadabacteria bacterium]|nr:MAG: GHKL domain-containing protein [Candidatus Dadabacteria bacterium]